jgi:hypothetical protein
VSSKCGQIELQKNLLKKTNKVGKRKAFSVILLAILPDSCYNGHAKSSQAENPQGKRGRGEDFLRQPVHHRET